MGDNLNNENSKKEKPNFVLNDVIKKKILDMYKISKPRKSESAEETNKIKSPDSNL